MNREETSITLESWRISLSHRTNPFLEARKDRKLEIVKYLANPNPLATKNKGVLLRRLMGAYTTKWGVTARVFYDYIDELQDAQLIQVDGEYVKLVMTTAALNELFGREEAWKVAKET